MEREKEDNDNFDSGFLNGRTKLRPNKSGEVHSAGFTFAVEPNIKPSGPNSYGKHEFRYKEQAITEKDATPRLAEAWRSMIPNEDGSIEAMSPPPAGTVAVFTKQNMLVKAVHAAFYDHHPLILSPDAIWITIAQGLANHVDQNAEKLRHLLVSHEKKKDITIVRPEFEKGSPYNDWESVFFFFSQQIDANTVGGTTDLITCDFSTTTPVERIASQITLMDTVQHFFSYTLCCGCGFPSITLRGTTSDWEKVRAKAERLRAYDLDWWLDHLLPALDEFVAASRGAPNLLFWRALCHINVGTSFPNYVPLTGWINVFFPYLNASGLGGRDFDEAKDGKAKKELKRNPTIGAFATSMQNGTVLENFGKKAKKSSAPFKLADMATKAAPIGTACGSKLELFPPSMSSAPFKLVDMATKETFFMAFFGGITTLVQHPEDGAIEPTVGWAVLDSGRKERASD